MLLRGERDESAEGDPEAAEAQAETLHDTDGMKRQQKGLVALVPTRLEVIVWWCLIPAPPTHRAVGKCRDDHVGRPNFRSPGSSIAPRLHNAANSSFGRFVDNV